MNTQKANDVISIEICKDIDVGGWFARAKQVDGQERDIPLDDNPTEDDALSAVCGDALCGYPVSDCSVTR